MREFLLLVIARFSLIILSPVLLSYGLIKGTLNGTLFTWFTDIAISIGRFGSYNGLYFNGSICNLGIFKTSLMPYVNKIYTRSLNFTFPFLNI